MKIIKVCLVLLTLTGIGINSARAQLTFTVTDVVLANSAGSLDSVLYEAIDSANVGNDVTVYFNASGLCQINAFLPPVDITDGSITFDKHPSASVTQGLRFTAAPTNTTVTYGLSVSNNDSLTWVLIKNLTFEDFRGYYAGPYVDRSGIYLSASFNVEVIDCKFDYNSKGVILFSATDQALIHYNDFVLDTVTSVAAYACFYLIYSNNYINKRIDIDHNTINNPILGNTAKIPNGIEFVINATIDSTSLYITNNTVNNCAEGIVCGNYGSPNNDPRLKLYVKDNLLNSNRIGLRLLNALEYWSVTGNIFNSIGGGYFRGCDIFISEYYGVGNSSVYGIDFIESNSLGYTTVNTGNQWLGTSGQSFEVYGDHGTGVTIVGLDVPSRIISNIGKYVEVRETRIAGTTPIDQIAGGNEAIDPPTIVGCASSGTTLLILYNLSGNEHVQNNAQFKVDFYESNGALHLKEFIGSQTVDSITGAPYVVGFTIPEGLTLLAGDTIRTTVTAYGNLSGPDTAIGTSEASYAIIQAFACDDFSFVIDDSTICDGHEISLTFVQTGCEDTLTVEFGDGNDTILAISGTPVTVTHTYDTLGTYSVVAIVTNTLDDRFPISDTINVTVRNCEDPPCTDCLPSFAPIPGRKYLLSAWVKEEGALPSKTDYTFPEIEICFPSDADTLAAFTPEGSIIDGWQRIEGTFTIPDTSTDIAIRLISNSGNCFFDDIRVLPFDGSLKSFVYDPIHLRLVAELDERNYATLYEYDEEGKLARVKKETEKGIMTIKENRSVTQK